MSRESLAELWQVSHDKSGVYTAFGDALKGLTPEQAAWKPDPERHSIWQIVNHLTYWREVVVGRQSGKSPADEEIARRNWEQPATVSADAWSAAIERFQRSQKSIHAALLDEKVPLDDLKFLPAHDVYHLGQIMYVRALQGLPPVS